MKKARQYLPFAFLIGLLIWAICQTVQINDLAQDVKVLSDDISQVAAEREQLMQAKALSVPVSIEVETSVPEPEFAPIDIPLDVKLQEHAWELCQQNDIPFEIVMSVAWHESRFQVDAVGYNRNGTTDSGVMQINSCNWQWLYDDHDLDISDPYDNIEAGIHILSMFWSKYPPEEALTAYAWGEQGMLDAGCIAPSAYRVLEKAAEYA